MVIPAAEPTKQRYTAGSCVLEVVVQPSVLSQWSDRLVADSVMFKLWLANSTDSTTRADVIQSSQQLVAQGDRPALQSITQYIQTRTRQLLAISAFSRPSSSQSSNQQSSDRQLSDRQSSHTETIAYPPEFEYSQPLSYLQLCDLNTVLSQYERAVLTVPSVPAEQLSENIILLPAVRDRQTDPTANIVQLPRKPRRVALWTSAAAAALAAIGLTTALWPRESTVQELAVEDKTAISARGFEPQTVQVEQDLEGDSTDSFTSALSETLPNADKSQLAENLPTDFARNTAPTQTLTGATTAPAPVTEQNSIGERSKRPSTASQSAIADLSIEPLPTNPARERPELGTLEIGELETSDLGTDEIAPEIETFTPENNILSRSINNNAQSAETTMPNSAASTTPPAEFIQGPTSTVSQVQTYFQQRWQGGDNASLLYELRLSPTGEVVSFVAINDAAKQQRDRIFPSTARPSFVTNTGGSSLTLRVVLNGDGTVQVIENR